MRPNLKSCYVTQLMFQGTSILTEEQIGKIRSISSPDKDGDSVFASDYPNHNAWALVMAPRREAARKKNEFRFAFAFQPRFKRVKGGIPGVEQLVEAVSGLEATLIFDCSVQFEFRRQLKPRPIICLPMRCTQLSSAPFDRIEGVHLAKLDGGRRRYDVILEGSSGGVISENVMFSQASSIDISLADRILAEAVRISDTLVQRG